VRRTRSSSFPNVWPVVADFFVAVLAVFVFVEARAGRPDPELPRKLRAIRMQLLPLVQAQEVKEAQIEYPEARVVFSDQYLSFPPCGWDLTAEKATQVQRVLDLFDPVAQFISALSIEGHADKRRPTGCHDERGVSVRTNFELSQRRALSVYAALLHVETDKVEDEEAFNGAEQGLVWGLRRRHRVLVAGYGDTRPWPDTPDPINEAHRRVEIKFSFCRQSSDAECAIADGQRVPSALK
jgi:outer membrane protein OmpA-like peptidoglycan-associated protein